MDRQLDIQVYKAINGYHIGKVSEDRFDDYMSVYHFSSDITTMPILLGKLVNRYNLDFASYSLGPNRFRVSLSYGNNVITSFADTLPFALSKATYKYFSGREWSEVGEDKSKNLYNMLKELEWVEEWNDYCDGFIAVCSYCKMAANIGHESECELNKVLREYEERCK